jgi:hypothetical protein
VSDIAESGFLRSRRSFAPPDTHPVPGEQRLDSLKPAVLGRPQHCDKQAFVGAHDAPRLVGNDRHDIAGGVLLGQILIAALRHAREQPTPQAIRPGERPSAVGGLLLFRPQVATPGDAWFDRAVRDSGVPAGFHPNELRHTAASLPGLSAAANVKAVQRMLGHAKASMTLNVYADLFDDDLEAVADRLDEVARRADFLRTGDVIVLPGPRPQAADVRFCGGDEGT